jgi:FkbM family methyltransferase
VEPSPPARLCRPFTLDPSGLHARLVARMLGLAGVLEGIDYRLYAAAAKLLGALAPRHTACTVRLAPDVLLRFDLTDFYWNRLLGARYEYEPELAALLGRLADLDYTFVDCGANYGYWTLMASGAALGGRPVIAVEAMPTTFRALQANLALNGRSVVCLHRAIAERPGEAVEIYERDRRHAGASLKRQWTGGAPARTRAHPVTTVTLDELVRQHTAPDTAVVVKLDVEGMEAEAMRGAGALLRRPFLVIYEDHGGDRSCAISRLMLETLGLRLYHVTPAGRVLPMPALEQVRAVKRRPTIGYNFLAAPAGGLFDRRLQAMSAADRSIPSA